MTKEKPLSKKGFIIPSKGVVVFLNDNVKEHVERAEKKLKNELFCYKYALERVDKIFLEEFGSFK